MIKTLASRHLDGALTPWRNLPPTPRPAGGWLRAIREALGMTTRQMAKSLGVTQAAIGSTERTEARGDITLATLRRYAAALDCEVVYALVPRQPIQARLEARAEELARDEVARVSQSMALEGQSTSASYREREVAQLSRKLLEGKRSRLWR